MRQVDSSRLLRANAGGLTPDDAADVAHCCPPSGLRSTMRAGDVTDTL
jgi:hypothetical protein